MEQHVVPTGLSGTEVRQILNDVLLPGWTAGALPQDQPVMLRLGVPTGPPGARAGRQDLEGHTGGAAEGGFRSIGDHTPKIDRDQSGIGDCSSVSIILDRAESWAPLRGESDVTQMRCSRNEHVERELTALDVVGVISAVAGVAPAVIAVCRAWTRTLRERAERDGALSQLGRDPAGACGRSFVVVRYEPPEGGRVTVWTTTATPANRAGKRERGPW
ncbi:hypothetical protein AB0940_29145 [Streptomyces sp. NPDC006656]|uniref:hypothetical protein n=1 Tax=Streptomyces sp. NPDC006656 TaxID=3156899 RepID=UPI003453BE6D